MLKATGIVRRIDDLGRVVIPKEFRKVNNWSEGDPLEFYSDANGALILRKYAPGCAGCGESGKKLLEHRGKQYCLTCLDEFAHMAKLAAGRG